MNKVISIASQWLPLIILLLVIIGVFRYVSGLFKSAPLKNFIKENEEEIVQHSKDVMTNGYTYLSASERIFKSLYNDNIFGWAKFTDKVDLGNFMLTVQKAEFTQLCNTYLLYKQDKGKWILGATKDGLEVDLKDCFNKQQCDLYLKHLL